MPSSNVAEFRHARSGSLNIPPQNAQANGLGNPRFDGPRSPPNTSHVPCKFFRQGACQAGNACPFSHDIGSSAENVCKYFAKGNCKFGPKCANVHVLPDGRRINYGKNGMTIGATPITLGGRVNPTAYGHSSNSALTNSFMRADSTNAPPYSPGSTYAAPVDEPQRYVGSHHLGRQPSLENGLPTIDTTYSSNPTSAYGSPRDNEDMGSRFGLGLSPVNAKGLSVLDAPLPASFDSNGVSMAARYGPWPSSVPSKFGLESPSPSLNAAKDSRTSEALKLLHTSAFGSSEYLPPSLLAAVGGNEGLSAAGVASSPPSHSILGAVGDESIFGKRAMAMHSSSQRYAKPRLLSSSAPKVDRDWEPQFLFEEDYVPGALANEVLTPAEKARRGSNATSIRIADAPDANTAGEALSATSTTKFGSPVGGMAASPSRWGPLFQRHRGAEEELESGSLGSGPRSSMKHAASAFGHVGSPLRNSSLANNIGELSSSPGNSSGRVNAGSRLGTAGEPLSALTQQLQRTRLGDETAGSSGAHLHPNTARSVSGNGVPLVGAGVIGKERERERGLERHVSSGSIGSSVTGRFTTPIDEEDSAFVFSMEEEDDAQSRARKRTSGGAPNGLVSGWTYSSAGIASTNPMPAVNGSKGHDGGSASLAPVGGR